MNEWTEIGDYIEELLRDGKRANHEDFQILFRVFGKEKIVNLAKDILERMKREDNEVPKKGVGDKNGMYEN